MSRSNDKNNHALGESYRFNLSDQTARLRSALLYSQLEWLGLGLIAVVVGLRISMSGFLLGQVTLMLLVIGYTVCVVAFIGGSPRWSALLILVLKLPLIAIGTWFVARHGITHGVSFALGLCVVIPFGLHFCLVSPLKR